MSNLILHGDGEMTLSVDRGCLILRLNKMNRQIRVIPILNILCVEVFAPQEDHRGYIYFRTPAANKLVKPSVTGRDIAADDDMVFFTGRENYEIAIKIQEYIVNFFSTY